MVLNCSWYWEWLNNCPFFFCMRGDLAENKDISRTSGGWHGFAYILWITEKQGQEIEKTDTYGPWKSLAEILLLQCCNSTVEVLQNSPSLLYAILINIQLSFYTKSLRKIWRTDLDVASISTFFIYIYRGRLAFYDPYISVHLRGRNRTFPNLLPRVEAIVYTYAMTNYEYHYSFYKMSCHFGIRLSK